MRSEASAPRPVVAIVIPRDGLLLVGERADGNWGFPGGKQDLWETPLAAGRRELREETGLELVQATPIFFADCQFREQGNHYVTLFLEAEAAGEPQLCEPDKCRRWCWRAVDDIPLPQLPGLTQLLASGYRP